MEVDSEVWIKGKETKKNANDGAWSVGKVISKVASATADSIDVLPINVKFIQNFIRMLAEMEK